MKRTCSRQRQFLVLEVISTPEWRRRQRQRFSSKIHWKLNLVKWQFSLSWASFWCIILYYTGGGGDMMATCVCQLWWQKKMRRHLRILPCAFCPWAAAVKCWLSLIMSFHTQHLLICHSNGFVDVVLGGSVCKIGTFSSDFSLHKWVANLK